MYHDLSNNIHIIAKLMQNRSHRSTYHVCVRYV